MLLTLFCSYIPQRCFLQLHIKVARRIIFLARNWSGIDLQGLVEYQIPEVGCKSMGCPHMPPCGLAWHSRCDLLNFSLLDESSALTDLGKEKWANTYSQNSMCSLMEFQERSNYNDQFIRCSLRTLSRAPKLKVSELGQANHLKPERETTISCSLNSFYSPLYKAQVPYRKPSGAAGNQLQVRWSLLTLKGAGHIMTWGGENTLF